MPQHYDIPWPYAPLPTPMAGGDLIGSYHTAASASLRAAITLDGLAVTTGAPNSLLADCPGPEPARWRSCPNQAEMTASSDRLTSLS